MNRTMETRDITINGEIKRALSQDKESRTVEGYAVIFESMSENMGFYEIIHKGAITEETINNSIVLVRLNHSDEKILAKSTYGKGSLLLEVDERGMHYLFDSPHTVAGDEILEQLDRGDITNSSFAFTIADEAGAEKWENIDGKLIRHIYKINQLYDVAPCAVVTAYSSTTCAKRAMEMVEQNTAITAKMDALSAEIENL